MNREATPGWVQRACDGGADRSGAEIPVSRDGTRTRDLSARLARTVLTDPWGRAEGVNVPAALPLFDCAFASSRSGSSRKVFLMHEPPRAAASSGRCAPRLVSAETILEIVGVTHVVAARGLALEDVHPVGHQQTSHPSGWLEEVRWRGRRDSNPRPVRAGARTVLADRCTRTESLDECPALSSLNRALAGNSRLTGPARLLVHQSPRAAAFVDRRPSLVVPTEAIVEVVRVAYIEPAGRLALQDVHPVAHEQERHPDRWRDESLGGADGTRTRDLRRDRPAF